MKASEKILDNFNFKSVIFRRALRTAIAMAIAVLIYRYYGLTQGFWVPLTAIIVMQATTAATLRKGLQRFLGTVLGIILGSLLVMHIHNANIMDFCLILFVFIAYYLKAFNLVNYGIFVVPLTMMMVFLVSAIIPQESHQLIAARLYDTTIGALIGILVTLFIFPNSLKRDIENKLRSTTIIQYQYLNAIIKLILTDNIEENIVRAHKKRRIFEDCLSQNRLLFADWVYELRLYFISKKYHENTIKELSKLGQYLFALHHLALQPKPILPLEIVSNLQQIMDQASQIAIKMKQEKKSTDFNYFSLPLEQIKTLQLLQSDQALPFVATLLADLQGYQHCLIALGELR